MCRIVNSIKNFISLTLLTDYIILCKSFRINNFTLFKLLIFLYFFCACFLEIIFSLFYIIAGIIKLCLIFCNIFFSVSSALSTSNFVNGNDTLIIPIKNKIHNEILNFSERFFLRFLLLEHYKPFCLF